MLRQGVLIFIYLEKRTSLQPSRVFERIVFFVIPGKDQAESLPFGKDDHRNLQKKGVLNDELLHESFRKDLKPRRKKQSNRHSVQVSCLHSGPKQPTFKKIRSLFEPIFLDKLERTPLKRVKNQRDRQIGLIIERPERRTKVRLWIHLRDSFFKGRWDYIVLFKKIRTGEG